MKQLYQLYSTHSGVNTYRGDSTDYILTLDSLADVFMDEGFNEVYDYIFEDGVVSYYLMSPDNLGQIPIKLTCRDGGDFVSRELVLVPVHSFIS